MARAPRRSTRCRSPADGGLGLGQVGLVGHVEVDQRPRPLLRPVATGGSRRWARATPCPARPATGWCGSFTGSGDWPEWAATSWTGRAPSVPRRKGQCPWTSGQATLHALLGSQLATVCLAPLPRAENQDAPMTTPAYDSARDALSAAQRVALAVRELEVAPDEEAGSLEVAHVPMRPAKDARLHGHTSVPTFLAGRGSAPANAGRGLRTEFPAPAPSPRPRPVSGPGRRTGSPS